METLSISSNTWTKIKRGEPVRKFWWSARSSASVRLFDRATASSPWRPEPLCSPIGHGSLRPVSRIFGRD